MTEMNIKNSTIHGPLAGGNQTNIYYQQTPNPEILRKAIEKLEKLSLEDEEYRDFIDRLGYYLQERNGRTNIGLEQKLLNGGREDLVDDAIMHKDFFAKKIARGQLARRRQYIYFYILQKISASFESQIRPLIRSGATPADIDATIYINIINTIFTEVIELDISIDQYLIYGMLYYLTGMCHLVWEK